MWKKWTFIIIGLIILYLILPYMLPIVFAGITAAMLERVIQTLIQKVRFKRLQAVLVTFLSYIILLFLSFYYAVSTLTQKATEISKQTTHVVINFYESGIYPLIKKWEQYVSNLPPDVISSIEKSFENNIEGLNQFLRNTGEAIISLLTTIPSFLVEFLIYLIALFLISLEFPNIINKFNSYLKDQTREKINLVLKPLANASIGFIKAQIILSFITFLLAFTGLWILQVPYKSAIALLIVIVDILPILGTGSVLVPWAVVAFLQNNDFLGTGLILLFVLITIIRRIIEPKVLSQNLGISPLASLISLFIGFKLIGFIGMFVGPGIVIVWNTLVKANIIKLNFRI
ncbi:sporulation integral membrane protein YtvI [Bacillus sp. CGMCC 1.16607]|uniref:sporulation integral membrane protein YtvI n=1 Tax=Bacillus sp. CGMCC 1.16607 TaxID=3351842 RepID=UPI00362945FF